MTAINEKVQLNLFEVIVELDKSSNVITEKMPQLIKTMLKSGMSPRAISVLLDLTPLRKEHKQYFGAPVISSDSLWHDMIPVWLKLAIYQERLEIICDEHNRNEIGIYAGYPEAVALLLCQRHSGHRLIPSGWIFILGLAGKYPSSTMVKPETILMESARKMNCHIMSRTSLTGCLPIFAAK